ncbi:MAG: glycosyltransferase [Verrucomicrobiota bacterium]
MSGRVLYIYEGKLGHHGIDRVVREQLEALASRGCLVDLASRGNPDIQGVSFLGKKWTVANLFSWLPRSFYYPAQKRVFMNLGARLAARRDYSKIISWRERALMPFRAGTRMGIDCYLSHDAMHWRGTAAEKNPPHWPAISLSEMDEEFRLAKRILLPSENSMESFLRNGLPAEKLKVIGRGVDTGLFTPDSARGDSKFRLVFCGRVGERKGIRQVVEAWKQANLPDAELLVLGNVDKDLQDFVDAHSGGNIHWLGFQKDILPILRKCDAQILLSRREGMAKALLEGASCGLATITTKDSGFPMRDGINGFLVEREDTGRTAKWLRLLSENRDRCREMGIAGRNTVVEDYSWAAFRKRFLEAVDIEG